MQQNRAEYESVLGRAMQPPPQKVCASSVYIEHVITYVQAVVTCLYYRVLSFLTTVVSHFMSLPTHVGE
jgi:hypothetical protein